LTVWKKRNWWHERNLLQTTAEPLCFVLTPKGHEAWKEASITYYRIVRRVFTNWLTETDVVAMHRVFSKVLDAD